jgi:hypothetical protein
LYSPEAGFLYSPEAGFLYSPELWWPFLPDFEGLSLYRAPASQSWPKDLRN